MNFKSGFYTQLDSDDSNKAMYFIELIPEDGNEDEIAICSMLASREARIAVSPDDDSLVIEFLFKEKAV